MRLRRAGGTDCVSVRVTRATKGRNTNQITQATELRIAFVDTGIAASDVRRGTATHAASRGSIRGLPPDDAYWLAPTPAFFSAFCRFCG